MCWHTLSSNWTDAAQLVKADSKCLVKATSFIFFFRDCLNFYILIDIISNSIRFSSRIVKPDFIILHFHL